jgi:polyhydroxyalkanoic acid synthase PhaR subunit
MSEAQSSKSQFDLFAAWRPFQEAWAKAMSETVSSEEFARAMGQSIDNYLETTESMRQQMEKAMERYLHQVNLPTRGELTSLSERLANLELRVDDLDTKLDEALDHLKAIRQALVKQPPARKKRTASKSLR